MKLYDIIVKANLAKSKTEARKSILGKGIRINNFTVIDSNCEVFVHEHLWLLVESNRLTTINTKTGTITSKDLTKEEFEDYFNKKDE